MIGTPLIQILDQDAKANLSSASQQRYKSQKQQIVTDAQGRRRLHGAFTGGYSAGYHNTVDSIAGFVPRTFVSNRSQKRGIDDVPSSSFTHKPEDYMDEEDQAEFGIAPKKIRVVGGYVNNNDRQKSSVIVNCKSLGERILKNIYLATNHKRPKKRSSHGTSLIYPEKDNYHGIGYQPLKSNEKQSDIRHGHDPLEALFRDGKKLKISGQAFGMGVLNDDDGLDDDLSMGDVYGHDNINNYEFPASRSKLQKHLRCDLKKKSNHDDPYSIPNFILTGTIAPNDEISCKLPKIPHEWRMPRRETKTAGILEKQRSFLDSKFVTSSCNDKTGSLEINIESKSGLLNLSELKRKEADPIITAKNKSHDVSIGRASNLVKIKTVEWRPCSLLCKRFNVPNPFPDNLYFGVKPEALLDGDTSDSNKPQVDHDDNKEIKSAIAPMKLRCSIYDQVFSDTETMSSDEDDDRMDDNSGVVSKINEDYINQLNHDSEHDYHEDDECIVVSIQRKEPELILLDSSSSSSS